MDEVISTIHNIKNGVGSKIEPCRTTQLMSGKIGECVINYGCFHLIECSGQIEIQLNPNPVNIRNPVVKIFRKHEIKFVQKTVDQWYRKLQFNSKRKPNNCFCFVMAVRYLLVRIDNAQLAFRYLPKPYKIERYQWCIIMLFVQRIYCSDFALLPRGREHLSGPRREP